ncbi:MAG: cytochrome c, class I [Gallionellales bacterium GWA2_60_18]|nr:MAG: cytochrome c, class I [Gallionellales bacterium GWA2_60_18]
MKPFTAALILLAGSAGSLSASAADLVRGQKVYETHCISCHGAHGVSVAPGAPNFARGETLMQQDMQLLQSVKLGKMMQPPFFGILSDQEITDAIAYARTLYK